MDKTGYDGHDNCHNTEQLQILHVISPHQRVPLKEANQG
jgi:hypothetical protein